jgi:hypothetical protein
VFTIEDRQRVRQHLIDMARSDPRIVAAAEVGSLTQTTDDRWSDVDLTFGVRSDDDVEWVLPDWTERLAADAAVALFDWSRWTRSIASSRFPAASKSTFHSPPVQWRRRGPSSRCCSGPR